MRALTTDEIRLVNEINKAAQKLDVIGKAKVIGFIAGLTAKSDSPRVRKRSNPAAAVV